MNLQGILAPIIRLFERTNTDYAIIGGFAVAAWGELRATRDIDFLCSVKDLDTLKSGLTEEGFAFEHRVGDSDDPISHVIRIDTGSEEDIYDIDVLAGIKGAPADLLLRARIVPVESIVVKVAGPEDMVVLKLLGGSARDMEDARGILRLQNKTISLGLLRRICPDHLKGILGDLLKAEA